MSAVLKIAEGYTSVGSNPTLAVGGEMSQRRLRDNKSLLNVFDVQFKRLLMNSDSQSYNISDNHILSVWKIEGPNQDYEYIISLASKIDENKVSILDLKKIIPYRHKYHKQEDEYLALCARRDYDGCLVLNMLNEDELEETASEFLKLISDFQIQADRDVFRKTFENVRKEL